MRGRRTPLGAVLIGFVGSSGCLPKRRLYKDTGPSSCRGTREPPFHSRVPVDNFNDDPVCTLVPPRARPGTPTWAEGKPSV